MLNNDGSIAQSRISSEKFLGIKVNSPQNCIHLGFFFCLPHMHVLNVYGITSFS